MLGSDFKSFFLGGTRGRELRKTRRAWRDVQSRWRRSQLATRHPLLVATALVNEAMHAAERSPATPLLIAIADGVEALYAAEDISEVEADWEVIETSVDAAIEFREMLARRRRWIADYPKMYGAFSEALIDLIVRVFRQLPESCFDVWDNASDTFETPLIDLLDDPAEVIDTLFMLPWDDTLVRLGLFRDLRNLSSSNLLIASGFLPTDDIDKRVPKLIRPTQQKGKTGAELADLYLRGSPLKAILEMPVPFHIPEEVRFEHCHIVGGTGHGKTQLMQKIIHADLVAAREDGRSVIVIDSQGDLINKLVQLDLFSPHMPDSLSERLILIDPADVEFPVALNLFDAHLTRVRDYSPADRERVLNGVIELYEMFFGAFLGAELTQKQGVIFKYLARLMLAIPDATIYTLMKIMEDGKPFKKYMDELDGSARYFFETEFFHPSFAATKKQVLRRLWGVLSTPAFERMFTQPRNKIDLFEAMNDGKIILVSTAKDLLKREGSQLLGRFFIAMIQQAALERSTIQEYRRQSVFVYVDEAQEYFDDSIETILNQARKYRVGLTIAHQTLDQLAPKLRSAILTNTSIKCVGGVSAKDAHALALELRTTPDFIEGMKRRGPRSEFAVWVKHLTGQAIRLTVPLGFLESQPTLDMDELMSLIVFNRDNYCGTIADGPQSPPPDDDPPASSATEPPSGGPQPPPRDEPPPQSDAKPDSDAHQEAKEPEAEQPAKPEAKTKGAASEQTAADEKAQERPKKASPRPPHEDRELGKGGKQHRYLQSLIKQLAEAQGLKATIEAPLPTGNCQVDVLIERNGVLAAIEISVTTPVEQEREHLRKCLAAGYPRIAVVLAKSKTVQASYRAALSEVVGEGDRERVRFLTPEELPDFIASLAPPPEPTERIVKGYRVKGSFTQISEGDAQARQDAVARLIAKSLSSQQA
jgi:hypothetical protein